MTSYIGRTRTPIPSCNAEEPETDLPLYESFGLPGRGPEIFDDHASGGLDVLGVDMFIRDNRNTHYTAGYDNDHLIVRRGMEFCIGISCSRPIDPHVDEVQVEFLIGANPSATKGSFIIVTLCGNSGGGAWAGRVVENRGDMIVMGITPAPNAIVGKFRCYVAVATNQGMTRTKRDPSTDLYMLFNPWSPADTVFLNNESERMEYVMNEYGTIYQGDESNISWRPWGYGQFEKGILDACIYIMDRCHMPIFNRGDPIKVTRKASASLNTQDDNGVLVGNWSDDYSLGCSPTSWTGSCHILLEYAAKGIPIKFAQCWVFAGVLTTFLRCLGIPTRSITNFSSAHDNTGNLKCDLIFTPDGRADENNTRDSIWNYHCWNECWMARPDLPAGMGGWQVVDATPQETSDGVFRCGPSSVVSIKEGTLCHPYDAPFVFAEVNSDVVFHKRTKYGTMEAYRVDSTHVGKLILTKSVGRDQPMDITRTYKYPEGSPQDVAVMESAEMYGCMRDHSELPDYDVAVDILSVTARMGDNFDLVVEFKNLGDSPRTVSSNLNCSVTYYTGVTVNVFKEAISTVNLEVGQTKRVVVDIQAEEYMPMLKSQNSMQFIVTGHVMETDQTVTALRVVNLQCPSLDVKVHPPGPAQVDQQMSVTVTFFNTFAFILHHVMIALDGMELLPYRQKIFSEIAASGTVTWTETFTPKKPGAKKLLASLDCTALRQVYGAVDLTVVE